MKKIFTFSLLLTLGLAAKAQDLTVYPKVGSVDGASTEYELVVHALVKNQGSDTTVSWYRFDNSLETKWEASICDDVSCWAPTLDSNTFVLHPGDSSIMDVHFYLSNTPGNGTVKIAVWSGDNKQNADTITYHASTWALHTASLNLDKNVKVYPNPSKGQLNVDFKADSKVTIEVFDVLGKKMRQLEYQGEHNTFDLSGMPNGLYILRITENGQVYSRTFKLAN